VKGFQDIPRLEMHEAQMVSKQMRCNTAADVDRLMVKLFKDSSLGLRLGLVRIFNDMLRAGSLEPKWPNALFTLLPKFGGNSKPNSWRPIAILKVTYKKNSKIVYVRLRNTAEAHQGIDQTGFWPGTGLEDAFFFRSDVWQMFGMECATLVCQL
jgi:hypothetical protein